MKRPYIPFSIIIVLLLLTIPSSLLFGNMYFPDLQTRNYSLGFIFVFTLLVISLFITVGYWLFSKQVNKTIWTLYAFHMLLTIPTILFLRFPAAFIDIQQISIGEALKTISFRKQFIPIAWTLFFAGQVFLLIYYIKTIKINRPTI